LLEAVQVVVLTTMIAGRPVEVALEVIDHLIQLTEILVVAHQQNHQSHLTLESFTLLQLVLEGLVLLLKLAAPETAETIHQYPVLD
jgi:hypothetical protein